MDSSDTVVVAANMVEVTTGTVESIDLLAPPPTKPIDQIKSVITETNDTTTNDVLNTTASVVVNGVSEPEVIVSEELSTSPVESVTATNHVVESNVEVAAVNEVIQVEKIHVQLEPNIEIKAVQNIVPVINDDFKNEDKHEETVQTVPLSRTLNVEAIIQTVVPDIVIVDQIVSIEGSNTTISDAPGVESATKYPAFDQEEDNKLVDSNDLPEFTMKALNDIAAKNGFVSFSIRVEPGSKKYDGFAAEIYKVTITETSEAQTGELVVIVKLPPTGDFRRDFFGLKLFKREVFIYNEVLPAFAEFQRQHGLRPGVNGFFAYPHCHFALYDEDKNESVIIMEDIRYQNYFMEDRYKPIKYDYAKSAMQHLGQFHAISLAMKDQAPEKFESFKNLKDFMSDMYESDLMLSMFDNSLQNAVATLEPSEQKIKDKLLGYGKLTDAARRCNNGELSEPFSVLSHGDFHINNVMFNLELGIPKHVCFFDWQLSRYASPAIDILYFIFMCTDKPLRDQHFDHLIQAYHNSLREQLELLNADVNQLFPFTALMRQLKQFGKFALGTSIFAIPMLCMARTEIPDMDEWAEKLKDAHASDLKDMKFELSQTAEQAYKIRMSGVLRDMYKKGYF